MFFLVQVFFYNYGELKHVAFFHFLLKMIFGVMVAFAWPELLILNVAIIASKYLYENVLK